MPAQPAPTPAIEIVLASGTPLEERGREQLQRLLTTFDLSRWFFTRVVRIQSRVIPHSHPVLTLNTQYVDDDTAQVATFVHEQIHWFVARNQSATDSAMAALSAIYPQVPSGPPLGARDLQSTYLHLLVCLLEYDAMRELVGQEAARRVLARWRHYTWVYHEVLERPEPIRRVLRRYRLDAPDSRV